MMDYKLLKSILKGALTFVPGVGSYLSKKKEKSQHSGSDDIFVYSLWLSTLVYLKENNLVAELSKICEIGNGGSLGIAFCALLTGFQKYYSLELRENIDFDKQLQLLDQIESLFNRKERIEHFDRLNIKIDNYEFPKETALPFQERAELVKKLKKELLNELVDSELISIVHNWDLKSSLGITFAFSRAAMEHVNNPHKIYQALNKHLIQGSFMLHDIEYHSHGITNSMNGHLRISPWIWFIIVGRRPFYLNRYQMSDHLSSIIENGFSIVKTNELYYDDNQTFIGGVIVAVKK
jgi:hypothetical protein